MAAGALEMRDEEVERLKNMVQHLQQENALLQSVQQNDFSETDDTNSLSTRTLVTAATIPKSPPVRNDELPEEECWLFKPPVNDDNSTFLSNVSCMQWAREVFDSPVSELAARRRDLLNRLEVILSSTTLATPQLLLPFGGSVPSLTNMHLDAHMITEKSANAASSGTFRSRLSLQSQRQQQTVPGNTATFTRPRRLASESVLQNHNQQNPSHRKSDTNISTCASQRSRSPTVKPSGSNDDLHNVDDLKNMMKMQADSLKAQVAAMTNKMGSQSSLNSSYLNGAGSAPGSPYSSTNRLNFYSSSSASNHNTPLSIAKMQEDDLKAEVAAMSAAAQAKMGSQQSLTSPSRGRNSGPESPYSSNGRLNISSSPVQHVPAHQPPANRLRYSLDSQRQRSGNLTGMFEGGNGYGEDYAWRPSPPPPSTNQMRYSPDFTFSSPHSVGPDGFADTPQQAVIVGRSTKIQRNLSMGSRLPTPPSKITGPRRSPQLQQQQPPFHLDNHVHHVSNVTAETMLPSYGWGGDAMGPPTIQPPPLLPRRIPPPPVRRGSELS